LDQTEQSATPVMDSLEVSDTPPPADPPEKGLEVAGDEKKAYKAPAPPKVVSKKKVTRRKH
jgi:hypothetical protein